MKNALIIFLVAFTGAALGKNLILFTKEGPIARNLSTVDSIKITGQDTNRVFSLFPEKVPPSPKLTSIDSVIITDVAVNKFLPLEQGERVGKP
ncbi:MAG: hypothetical protein JNL74_11180, partial [Fibrobacteres bacterium]|nr:hypothetical protein [Fibrobacterota bacterium]